MINLQSSITEIKGIGPKKAELFHKLGIFSIADVLNDYPKSYEDLRYPQKINTLKNDDKALVVAKVLLCNFGKGYGRKRTLHLLVEDNTGRMEILFFMAGFMIKNFEIGQMYHFFGKVKVENGRSTMFHPDYGKMDDSEQGIMPVYRLTKGLSQKEIRKLSKEACLLTNELTETLPECIIKNRNLCSNAFAYTNIHYPENEDSYKISRYRFVYEELLELKIALKLSKNRGETCAKGINLCSNMAEDFIQSLPFKLTNAQNKAVNDLLVDMRCDKTMNRLIQGDVGSGKTVVAECALIEAVFAGYQAVFMAPTEILSNQHFNNLKRDFQKFNINILLLNSSLSAKEHKQALEKIESGEAQIIVGTHALISDKVIYNNLGLVITDEQHRFGVSQRMKLIAKGNNPDILVMTATPIPRTLAVVLFADLDISIIDELPPGRQKIITKSYTDKTRVDAYKLLFSEVQKGRQAYIIAPFIEDSETIDAKSAESLYSSFVKKHPEISCALLHGNLSQKEKDDIMSSFYTGAISVLISTVVIEVGIDVPNATVMIIENSERFGLAQMHQLRGRVGRGQYESYCLICTGEESEVSKQRTKVLCSTNDGFEIAEKDLEIRGPGEFFGYRQHGLPQLVFADPIKHVQIAALANDDADFIIANDPNLSSEGFSMLKDVINDKYIKDTESLTI